MKKNRTFSHTNHWTRPSTITSCPTTQLRPQASKMRTLSAPSVWVILLGASRAFAAFETFSWAGQGGNSSAPRKCGDMIYECPAPSMCSMDTLTRKWYCCEPGNQDGPCWNGATTCGGSGTNQPSGQQISCSNLDVNYCCSDA